MRTRLHRTPMFALLVVTTALLCSCALTEDDPSMTTDAHVHHALDYLELGATDMAAAKAFYTAAFGWAFTDYGPEYAGIQNLGGAPGEFAGLRLEGSVARGGVLPALYSADLEASIAAVKAAGGEIVVEIFSFPGGRRFQFLDPSGNELAVYSDR